MKKTTRTARKVLSVFLAVLMMLTTWAVAVPGLVLAADGNKYYVKVYVNIYDGSDGYGGAYSVEESTGKPKNYSWVTNDGWYGRINMTGFTVFGEAGDYDAQDVSAALLEAEKLNTYYDMSGLSDNNANGDWDSKAIAKTEYTFVLDSFPVEIFWMNDENNWDGGNTGFAIRKLTVATSEGGTEHTMWEGLAGSDSETYNYYGSITPTGIHTCFEDYAKNYDMNDYKFYKAITSSSQRAWTDPYTYGSAGTYYLNEYANGGVSATFSEGATSVASTVDYIDTSSTDTYYVNYTNHSKTQIAEITGTYNDGNFVSSPYGIKLNPGETRSFEINKSNYSKLAKYNNAANFTFEYTLSNVYASDELNAPLAKFTQPTYIGLWNEANDSPKYITDEDGDGSTGYTLKMSDNYGMGNNSMTMTNTFQVTEGIIERNSATTGSGSNSVTFNYNYYVDVSNVSTWEDTGLRIYVTENEYYRLPFQPKEYPSECGTITLSGNYANTDAASITIADIAFTNVTEDFWYSHSQASGYSTYGYYNQKGTPMWATQGKDAQATFYNNNPGWLRFAGTMIEPSYSSADPAKIVMDKMVYRENQNGQKAYFSGTINVYAFDKAKLRDYIQKTLLDFAPMSLRYNTTAFENYQNKLASAMNVLANQKTTQVAVNQALAELKSAVAALQSNDNLINQIDSLKHIQYVSGIGSEIAAQTDARYVLIPLGEHTVPQKAEYIGNGTFRDATNKKSNLVTNYTKDDTEIDYLNYYYWNIDYSQVDVTIELVDEALKNFDNDTYSSTLKTALENAKEQLEAIDQTTTGDNTPTSQEDVDNVIKAATDLLAHMDEGYEHCDYDANDDGEDELKTKDSTCSEAGYTYYKCNICGKVQKVEDLELAEHSWDAGTETTAPECGNAGVITYKCLVCGATKTEPTTEIGTHEFQISDNGDGTHISKCSKCGANKEGATSEAHTYDYTINADGTHTATCSVCNATVTEAHTFTNPVLARPTLVDGVWENGTYTYTCEVCGGKKYVAVAREDYSAYDKALADANKLLGNDSLTPAAKDLIEDAIEVAEKLDQNLPEDVVEDGETIIDNDSAEKIADATNTLNNVLNGIVDDEGNIGDEYKKPDSTAAEEAVEKAEALEEKIELPEDVKTQIDELREELNGIIEEIANDDNATEAEYKDDLEAVEDAANKILEKYAACEKDGHKFGAEVIATYPVYDEASDTWSKGTYTKTCDVCGYVKSVAYDRANYEAYDKAVADLNSLLANENITAEAKAEINKVLTDNAIRYDLMTPDQSIVDAAVAKFVAEYNKLTDENGNLKDEYKKPDYSEWDKAETAYDALAEEELANVKTEIIEEAEALKTEIAEKEADETLTQATATQKEIDDATARLKEIIAGIKDGTLVKPDYSGAEDAIEDAKKVADSENIPDGTEAEIEAKIAELEEQLKEIKDSNPSSTNEEVNNKIEEIEQAAKDIINTYGECAKGNHTDVETDGDHNCDVCGKLDVTSHNYVNPQLTRPVYNEETGKWSDGYYTSTCNCGDTSETTIARADYEAYDNAKAALEALKENAAITTEAKAEIEKILADNSIDDNLVAVEQSIVDAAAAALKAEADKINNDTTGAYEKVDYTAYNAAVNAYNALTDVMSAEDKAAVEEIKTEIEKIPADGSKKDYQEQVDEAAAKIVAINAKYGDCANGNHNWGEPKLTTAPTADAQGEYTETCGTCGATQITKVDLADYDEFNAVVEALKNLANTENLTTEAAKVIADALAMAEELDKNLPADATTVDGKLIKGGQEEINALVAQLQQVVADTNTAISNGSALKPDYTDWEEAETAYDALAEEELANVKTEIIEEAEALKAEIAEKESNTELTQATATQDEINAATARLNEIIAGIKDGTLVKPDYSGAENAINDAKEVADSENIPDGTEAKIEAKIAELEEQLKEIKDSNPSSTDEEVNNKIEEIEQAAKDIINTYGECAKGNHTDVETDGDHNCDVCGKLDVTSHNYVNPQLTRPELVDGTWTNGKYTSTCNCGDTSETTIARADYEAYDKAVADLNALLANDKLTQTTIDKINAALEANKIADNLVKTAEEQKIVDDAAAALKVVLGKLTDENGNLKDEYKKPDYSEWKKAEAAYDALDKTYADENLVAEADALKAEIAKKEADETLTQATATQKEIDDATKRLNEIVAEISGDLNGKPDFDGYENSHDVYEELVKQYGDKIKDSVADDVAALDKIVDDVRYDETATKADDQKTVDDAKAALDAIIAGIENGSLIKPATPANYSEWDAAEKEYNELDKTRVKESIRVEVGELKISINTLKNDPATNAEDDQDTINAKTARLNEIIAGIKDGSLKVPDYSKVDEKLDEAKDADNVLDETKTAIESIEKAIEDLKNNNDINAKDDQPAVDALEEQLDRILEGIEDGSLVKPDYSEADKAIADADKAIKDAEAIEGKLDTTLTDEEKAAIDELKKELEDIKADLADIRNDATSNKKDDQPAVDALEERAKAVADSIKEVSDKYAECLKGNHQHSAEGTVTEPTCTEQGYTTYHCTVCGKTFKSDFVPALGHIDEDDDGTCDRCHATDIYAGCACLCHNNHWFWRIVYMIIRIVWKIFGIHQVCACGRIHF